MLLRLQQRMPGRKGGIAVILRESVLDCLPTRRAPNQIGDVRQHISRVCGGRQHNGVRGELSLEH